MRLHEIDLPSTVLEPSTKNTPDGVSAEQGGSLPHAKDACAWSVREDDDEAIAPFRDARPDAPTIATQTRSATERGASHRTLSVLADVQT